MLLTLFKNTNQLSSLVCEVKASPRHVVWLWCSHRQRVWTGQDRQYFVHHVSLLQPITEQITVSGLTQWRIARSSPIQNGETNRLVTLKSVRIRTSVYVPIGRFLRRRKRVGKLSVRFVSGFICIAERMLLEHCRLCLQQTVSGHNVK